MTRTSTKSLLLKNELERNVTQENMTTYLSFLKEQNKRLTFFTTGQDVEVTAVFLMNNKDLFLCDGKVNRKEIILIISFVGFFSTKFLNAGNVNEWLKFKQENPKTSWNTEIFKRVCGDEYERYISVLKSKFASRHRENYSKLSEDEKKKRLVNNKRSLEYWLSRGYDSEESKNKQLDYQRSNSGVFEEYYEIRGIENHGEIIRGFNKDCLEGKTEEEIKKIIGKRATTISMRRSREPLLEYFRSTRPSLYSDLKLSLSNIDDILQMLDEDHRMHKDRLYTFFTSVLTASSSSISVVTLFRFLVQRGLYYEAKELLEFSRKRKERRVSEFTIYKNYYHKEYFDEFVLENKSLNELRLVKKFFNGSGHKTHSEFVRSKARVRNGLSTRSASRGESSAESLNVLLIPLYRKLRRKGMKKEDVSWGIFGSNEFRIYLDKKQHYRYDFTIHSKKIIIEYDGWCHFSDVYGCVKNRDVEKEKVAAEHGYSVYRFPYTDNADEFIERIIKIIGEF